VGEGVRLEPAHALRPGGEHLRARRARQGDAHRALRRRDVAAAGRRHRPGTSLHRVCRGARRPGACQGLQRGGEELSHPRAGALGARGPQAHEEGEIEVDYTTYKTRSYRVSGERIQTVLGVKPLVGVKEAVEHMVRQIDERHQMDLYSPRYYNIEWMTLLSDMEQTLKRIGGVF